MYGAIPASGGNASVNERGDRASESHASVRRPIATLPNGRVSALKRDKKSGNGCSLGPLPLS